MLIIRPKGFHPTLARIRYISGSSCDRPSRSKMFTTDLDPTANADIERKFVTQLQVSHGDLSVLTSKISSSAAFQTIKLNCLK